MKAALLSVRRARVAAAVLLLALAAGRAAGVNIILNPSFETWLLGVPVGWLTSEAIAESSAVRDTNAHSGDYCIRLRGADTAAFATTTTIVRQGLHYEFKGHAEVPGLLGGSFVLEFFTSGLQPIGLPILLPAYRSTGYREYGRWVTAPDSAFFMLVTFATLPGAEAYVDDVTLDDTTLLAIEEPPRAAAAGRAVRKVLATAEMPRGLGPGAVMFDPAGRRVPEAGSFSRPGVYFIVERNLAGR